MPEEKVYEWDDAEVGHVSPPYVFEVTRERIADYCSAVRYDNPVYLDDDAARSAGLPGIVAPLTMCFTYAPMRRVDLINSRGYVAPEQASTPRSTPFVSGEVVALGSYVRPGDVVTSTTSIVDKYERKGNKFLVFQIAGVNQRGEKACEYLYTCLWEYAKGRKVREDVASKP